MTEASDAGARAESSVEGGAKGKESVLSGMVVINYSPSQSSIWSMTGNH